MSDYFEQARLLPDEVQRTTGKNLAALRFSQAQRFEIIREFGGNLPQSIMQAEKGRPADEDLAVGSYDASNFASRNPDHPLGEMFEISGTGCGSGALSTFPQNIGRTVLLLYSEPGALVFDPFAGHNSRMELCVANGRHYVGYDISARFMAFNEERAAWLREQYPDKQIELHHADSRRAQFTPPQSADFCLTSPPYYDIEDYGDEPEQLGKLGTYQEFLVGLQEVARRTFTALRAGAFCVWFVNDFRRRGRFHCYHIDTMRLLQSAGFTPWDIMIVDLGYPIRAAFATQIVEQRILPKRHEYGLIVKKQ